MMAGIALAVTSSVFSNNASFYGHCDPSATSWNYAYKQGGAEPINDVFHDFQYLGDNYFKLESFKVLKQGWNGYGARPIAKKAIGNTKDLLYALQGIPMKLFPVSNGSIQVEKHLDDDNLVEIEVSSKGYHLYMVKDGQEIDNDVTKDYAIKAVRELVNGESNQ